MKKQYVLFVLCLLHFSQSNADIYKAIDVNGRIYYTDEPKNSPLMPKNIPYKRIARTTSLDNSTTVEFNNKKQVDATLPTGKTEDGAHRKSAIKNTKSKERVNTDLDDGFRSFHAAAETTKNKLECPKSVDSDITPASFEGDSALYGCILGKAETVKWFINENPASKRISNVKFLWNDWFKDMGYGLHSDKQEAQNALKVLIELYAPEKAKELNKLFLGNIDKTITSNRFTLKYTYDRGPAIDERMIVVTETKAADNPIAPAAKIKPASVPAIYGDKNPNAAAIVICEGLKSTGNATNCEVNHFGLLVDATIDTNSIEAKKICVGVASEAAKYNSSFNDGKWKLRIFSPYSGDKPIAVCSL